MNASRLARVATSLSLRSAPSLRLRALSTIEGSVSGRGPAAPTTAPPPTRAALPQQQPKFPAALRRLARDGAGALRPKLVLSPYPEDPTAVMYRNEERPATTTLPTSALGNVMDNDVVVSDPPVEADAAAAAAATNSTDESDASEIAGQPEEGVEIAAAASSDDARRCWHKPKISRRKAHVMRKHAIRTGTYGAFDPETGTGWDASWDAGLFQRGAGGVDSDAAASSGAAGGLGGLGRYRVTVPKRTKRQRTREQRAQLIDRNLADMDARIDQYHAARHAAKPPDTFENLYKRLMRVKK